MVPANYHLTELIVQDTHKQVLHAGVKSTSTIILDTLRSAFCKKNTHEMCNLS
jgi:hypothetical protein